MTKYDKRLIERLQNWKKVYPEDEDKPEGDLYLEAAERIIELLQAMEKETPLYQTETISTDELTLRRLKYSLELCKESRDVMNTNRDMGAWFSQEDWDCTIRNIHALERVIDFYGT